jgi:uncharacterized membrane protein YfcA
MGDFSSITVFEWCLLCIAAIGIGISKSGLSGISMVHVMVFAYVFGALPSTGVVLPMLIVGDISATFAFGRHANWSHVRRMLPPALVGVTLGWLFMSRMDEAIYQPVIGGIILSLTVVQIIRLWRTSFLESVPHSKWFSLAMGILVGMTTMMANAAGPIFAIYLLSLAVPKMEFVGTGAWFFLLLNVLKVPFSYQMGLIDLSTLNINLVLFPLIPVGLWIGKSIVGRIPQKTFNTIILIFTAIAAIRLMT